MSLTARSDSYIAEYNTRMSLEVHSSYALRLNAEAQATELLKYTDHERPESTTSSIDRIELSVDEYEHRKYLAR